MQLNHIKKSILSVFLCSMMLGSSVPAQANLWSWLRGKRFQSRTAVSANNDGSNFWKWAAVLAGVAFVGYKAYKWATELECGTSDCSQVCGTRTMQSPKHENQDRIHVCVDNGSKTACFTVADGHGENGHYVADAITAKDGGICKKIKNGVERAIGRQGSKSEAIKQAFIAMHNELPENVARNSGAAVVSAYIKDNLLYIAHAGDSRAVVVRENGTVAYATKDHKPDDNQEKARIIGAGGFVAHHGVWRVNGCLAVSRALGDKAFNPAVTPEPTVVGIDLNDHLTYRYLILACDGVWDVLSNKDAAAAVKESNDIMGQAAKILVEGSSTKGSKDDITAIVVDLHALRNQFQSHVEAEKAAVVRVAKKQPERKIRR